MPRIKITGYIDTAELEEGQVDELSPTGLSEDGYMDLINDEKGNALSVADLRNVEVRVDR